ncbi:hypothetical protein ACS3UN_03835 [Oscillospiraceae bacterium LTW-04]|nr:hypothetical protein RBH76_06630 [Oscillospiraceae bacterium MB24-C1]
MQFIDLGFLFLLLPMSAAVYYCVPQKYKPAVLLGISVCFYYLMQPDSIWLLLTVIPDCLLLAHLSHSASENQKNILLFRLCIIKNFIVMLVFGLLGPFLRQTAVPVGIMVISLSLTELLVLQNRGEPGFDSPVKTAGGTLFFARFVYGPVGATQDLMAQLETPAPSLSHIAKGIMLLITGVAKQVVLSEQFFALLKTISRLPPGQFSVALGWLCALCSALGCYFWLSSVSNIARGIGEVFSLKLPRMLYYPFQARSIREYVYRLNIPLEDTVFRIIFPDSDHTANDARSYLVSFCMPLLLGLWFSPSGGFFLWGGYFSCLVLLDWLVLRHIPTPLGFAARLSTFVITLPAYVLTLPTTLGNRFAIITTMLGLGGVPLINDTAIYLFSSNFVLIIVGILACSNIFDLLGRATEQQFPRLWWIGSSLAHLVLLVVATSFLLWNVR